MANGHALVLGGGGVAGIAWVTGLLAGLAEAGQDVTDAIGANALDPATRVPAATAGRAQGRAGLPPEF